MAYMHIRNALSIINNLLENDVLPKDVKIQLIQAKKELYDAQDELVWIRSRGREIAHTVRDLIEVLGIEVRIGNPIVKLEKEELYEKLLKSPYIEATLNSDKDGKVKIEKIVVPSES
ncbi:MAG: hypothetical protein B6U94_00525 [Thermofilum sp. ex4484_79]|nr:MAG: hypothetical protein B6U94_00525 [Thermofilum sp. ex4484_79]